MDWEKLASERQMLGEALSYILVELGVVKIGAKHTPMELTKRAYAYLDKHGTHKSPWYREKAQ